MTTRPDDEPSLLERGTHEFAPGRSLATSVVNATARAKGTDPVDLSYLYEVIDPDALEALFANRADGTDASVTVSFPYVGLRVVVDSEGEIAVLEPGDAD